MRAINLWDSSLAVTMYNKQKKMWNKKFSRTQIKLITNLKMPPHPSTSQYLKLGCQVIAIKSRIMYRQRIRDYRGRVKYRYSNFNRRQIK
jgi:hypothetical protein